MTSIAEMLPAANEAPLIARSELRKPLMVLANALLSLAAVAIIALAVIEGEEIRHYAIYAMAPVIAMAVAWPSMQAFGLDRERLFIKATGADAFVISQIMGLAAMHTVHQTMHGGNPCFLAQIALIPVIAAMMRGLLDKHRDNAGMTVELDDVVPA